MGMLTLCPEAPAANVSQEHEVESSGRVQVMTRVQKKREQEEEDVQVEQRPASREVIIPWVGQGCLHLTNIRREQQLYLVLTQLAA